MKTLTEIAIECGARQDVSFAITFYTSMLQAFVDAVNAQNSESEVSSGGIDISSGGISSSCGGIAELEKDAERYRWLVANGDAHSKKGSRARLDNDTGLKCLFSFSYWCKNINEAIDEAMKGSK